MKTICSAAVAILFTGVSGFAFAQSAPPNADIHNSTTGAASTDVPMPSVMTHIPSGSDAAKFNAAADADDKKPTMAHALGLTDEQRKMISSSLAVGGSEPGVGVHADFKPEVAALMPDAAQDKVKDLPGAVTETMPWMKPYKYAVVDGRILLVDPVNDFMVAGILNR